MLLLPNMINTTAPPKSLVKAQRLAGAARTLRPAVDEIPRKKYLLHMLVMMFPLVSGVPVTKEFYFPQASPQAVHKLCHILHRLSTVPWTVGLCCSARGG
jgi:hypothetical protein